eukprot:358192-Chlamydomonas_euryale.AAC.8
MMCDRTIIWKRDQGVHPVLESRCHAWKLFKRTDTVMFGCPRETCRDRNSGPNKAANRIDAAFEDRHPKSMRLSGFVAAKASLQMELAVWI